MSNLKVDFENVNLNERKILSYANKVEEIHNKLNEDANKKDEDDDDMEDILNYVVY